MKKTILETTVKKIGNSATDFLEENMIIFFQENAPDYLADFCYLIASGAGGKEIRVGDKLVLDDAEFPVTAIGDVALENFENLGHLSVRFDGATQAVQPGTMHVADAPIPEIHVGTRLRFIQAD